MHTEIFSKYYLHKTSNTALGNHLRYLTALLQLSTVFVALSAFWYHLILSRISSKCSNVFCAEVELHFYTEISGSQAFFTEIFLCKCFRLNTRFSRVQSLKQHSLNKKFSFHTCLWQISWSHTFFKKGGKDFGLLLLFFFFRNKIASNLIEEQVSGGWGPTLLIGAQRQGKEQGAQTETWDIPSKQKEKLLYFQGHRAPRLPREVVGSHFLVIFKTHLCTLL